MKKLFFCLSWFIPKEAFGTLNIPHFNCKICFVG